MHTPFTNDQDPHICLAELRETEPVTRIATPDGPPAWLVTRYADVHQALLDDARFALAPKHASGRDYLGFALPRALSAHLLATDPPRHTDLRKHIAPSFTAARVRDLAPTIDGLAHQLVDALDADRPVDLVAEIAVPLPIALVAELLPLPDNAKSALTGWASRMLLPTPGAQPRARDTLAEMREILGEATRSPAPEGSLMAHLLDAHRREQITTDELTSMVFYILFVWLEPFVDAIGSTCCACWRATFASRSALAQHFATARWRRPCATTRRNCWLHPVSPARTPKSREYRSPPGTRCCLRWPRPTATRGSSTTRTRSI
jgi:cytochrome P450